MCRLLCYMGVPVPMEVLVTKPEHSLVLQSRNACFHPGCPDKRNIRVNGDGFGIAWYTPKRISEGGCVVKFPTPAWSSTNLLNIAKFVESGLVFAHVRAASDGAVLVGSVNHENTHPFKHKRYTFMHNGGIPGFDGMKRHLLAQLGDAAYKAIEGTTDSEVCFAFFLDELPNTDDQLTAAEIAQVLRQTIARIVVAVARFATPPRTPAPATTRAAAAPVTTATPTSASTCRNNGAGATHPARAADTDDAPDDADGAPAAQNGGSSSTASAGGEAAAAAVAAAAAAAAAAAPAMSLNFCVTDGRHIVCSRYRNHPWHDPPSLFVLSGAGFACEREGSCLRLTAAEPQTSVVISSEPLCRSTKSWELVPRNSMVVVEGVVPTPAAAAASDNGIGTTGERAQAVGSRGGDDDTSKPTSTTPGFGGAGAAAGGRAAAAEEPSGVGLVSSIRYEPLRCHPSDIPAPNDPTFPDPALLPTSCARVRGGGGGNGGGKASGGCLASKAGGGVKFGGAAGGREVFGNGVHGGVGFGGDETGNASGTQLREYEEAVSSVAAAAVTATATTAAAAASTASSSALRQGASAATLQQ